MAVLACVGWGVSEFLGGLSARSVSVLTVLAVSQAAGLAGIIVVLAARGEPPVLDARLLLAVGAGVAMVTELGLLYMAMTKGPIVVVAPVASAGAVLPVIVGLASGDPADALIIAGIACALFGACAAAWEPDRSGVRSGNLAAGAGAAAAAALAIGVFFVLFDAASAADPYWATGIMRISSLPVAIGLLLAVRHRRARRAPEPRLSRTTYIALFAIGLTDVGADIAFATASTHGSLSVTAVLASLYPVVTILLAAAILRERLHWLQSCGAAIALLGIALIAVPSVG